MTTELFWLTLTALLAASLWIPFIVISSQGESAQHQTFERMAPVWQMSDLAQRAYRAHLNLLEQFLPFAVLVLIAQAMAISTPVTVAVSVAFFWIRAAHAVGYIMGFARLPLRPMIFTAGWICILVYAWVVLTA